MSDIFDQVPRAAEQNIDVMQHDEDELISIMLEETETKPDWKNLQEEKQKKLPDFNDDPESEAEEIEAEELFEKADKKVDFDNVMPLDIIIDFVDMFAMFIIKKLCKIPDDQEEQVKTSAAEKKSLEKAAKVYLDSVDLQVTPLQGLLFAFGSVYGTKIFICKQMSKRIKDLETEVDDLKKNGAKK